VKIRKVVANNRRKAFEVHAGSRKLTFPYSRLEVAPSVHDRLSQLFVDPELGREAFTYVLESGAEGTVHIDHVLEYNKDPEFLRDLMVYNLTIEAKKRVEQSRLSKRELIRRLGTSAAQLYRLLDPKNTRKSIGQLVDLLHILDCEVEFRVRDRAAA
jgi:predicted XRE-type DNA-binding protein